MRGQVSGRNRVLVGALLLGTLSAALARADGWTQGPAAPCPREAAMAYDSERHRMVLIGGMCWTDRNDAWEWDGVTWNRAATLPAAMVSRSFTALVYDSTRKVTIVFGGFHDPYGGGPALSDTWEYDGASFTPGAAAPPNLTPRYGHGLGYDSARRMTVLFGGANPLYGSLADTWEYDGAGWTPGPAAPPALTPRYGLSVGYDASRQKMVLFGGWDGAARNDTWLYDGASWTPGPAAPPALTPRYGLSVGYDSAAGRMVMFGGANAVYADLNDVWFFDGTQWSLGPAAPAALLPRHGQAMGYDSYRGRFVMFGGTDTSTLKGDTWELDASGWTRVGPLMPQARGLGAMAYDSRRDRVVLIGGIGEFADLSVWEYDGQTWIPGPLPPPALTPRYGLSVGYDSARGRAVLFGGTNDQWPRSYYDDTWEYDGTAFIPGPAAPPGLTPRYGLSVGYDTARAWVVLFGGTDDTSFWNDTWIYDGTAWTLGPAAPPGMSERKFQAVAYDEVRQRLVLFGGENRYGDPLSDTWELDGSSWIAGPPAPASMLAREGHGMTFDVKLGRVVLFGGQNGDVNAQSLTYYGDSWTYDGLGWSALPSVPQALSARGFFASAYDARRGVSVFFGGYDGCVLSDIWQLGVIEDSYLVGAGLGPSSPNRVRAFDELGQPTVIDFDAYAAGQWGVNVAPAEFDLGTFAEMLTGPGPGPVFGPQVRGFARPGSPIGKINFFAYGTLKYGANTAGATTDLDPYDEILTGAGPGAVFGPQVRGFNYDGATVAPIGKINFFAYSTLKYGVNVGGGDIDGDGFAEIVTAPGPSAAFVSVVRAFNVDGGSVRSIGKVNFNAFASGGYGALVAIGDTDRDGFSEIACAPGPGASIPSQLLGFNYDAASVAALFGYDATPFLTAYGGRVGLANVDGAFAADVLAGSGPDPSADSTIKGYRYADAALVAEPVTILAFPGAAYGVNVTGGRLGY